VARGDYTDDMTNSTQSTSHTYPSGARAGAGSKRSERQHAARAAPMRRNLVGLVHQPPTSAAAWSWGDNLCSSNTCAQSHARTLDRKSDVVVLGKEETARMNHAAELIQQPVQPAPQSWSDSATNDRRCKRRKIHATIADYHASFFCTAGSDGCVNGTKSTRSTR